MSIPSNYEEFQFPGPGGLTSPKYDQYAQLYDSLVTTQVPVNKKAWGQFYNKLANSVNGAQDLITISASDITCPSTDQGIDFTSDTSVTDLSIPREFKATLQDVGRFLNPTNQNLNGNVMPFEFIITTSNTRYANSPISKFVTVDPAYATQLLTAQLCLTCALQVKASNTSGRPYIEPYNPDSVPTIDHSAYYAYLYSLATTANLYIADDEIIIKGIVWDKAHQDKAFQSTILNNIGRYVEVVCSLVVVSS